MNSEEIVICTIISKNYLAHARTLTDSFLKIHPKGQVFVLLVDDIEEHFEPKKEKFSLVNLNQIGIDDLESFCFKYTILEQNTGAKAHFLKYLFEKYNLKKLAYFDPDILFTNSLENVWKLLDKKSIVLTPHLTAPIRDNKKPTEEDIMKSGCYNLGFIGLANTQTTRDFLNWWIPRLMEHGYSDVKHGMFTDQKWMDFVPSLFDDVYIIKHPGYNVAYWNLMQRNVEISDNKITVDGKPMYFFHFSGYSPEKIEEVSKHQNRFVLKDLESLRPIFELYRDLLIENTYLETMKWKCKFDYFENGVKIPTSARKLYSESMKKGKNFGNPFSTTTSNPFIKFLNENVDNKQPLVTRLWYQIYKEREDLHSYFSDPLGVDRNAFVNWLENSLKHESDFDQIFLPTHLLKSSDQTFSSQLKTTKLGVNMSGYFKGEFGIAEAARNYAKSMKIAGIPHVLNNLTAIVHRNNDKTFNRFESTNPYPINLIAVNADQSDSFYNQMGRDYFRDKYNIAIWFWEISKFPEKWLSSLKYYDEIWVGSKFVAEAMSKSFPIPVINIGCPVEVDEGKFIRDRSKFNLADEQFVFLFIFDFLSIFERKNPLAVIEAFKKSFGDKEDVCLIIKCTNGKRFPSQFKKLLEACNEKNIQLFEEHMDKDDLYSLLGTCDCYISLHRSEGFALTIAEAMYARKPVIATGYGGNVDFMEAQNSFPVKYRITQIDKDYGPYKKGNVWAEPDINHACSLMKYVYENQNVAKEMGGEGSRDVKKQLNLKSIGMEISKRIESINKEIISSQS